MIYSKRTDSKEAFTNQVFKLFTDTVGGDPQEFGDVLFGHYTVEDYSYADDLKYFAVLGYFQKVVVPHKIEVYKAGVDLFEKINDVITKKIDKEEFLYNLWLHDLSKFSADESFGYAFHNFKNEEFDLAFEQAWHHHKMNNPHHPEWWLNPSRSGELETLPMSNIYVVEMVADWIGAGKIYGNPLDNWIKTNIDKFKWHSKTAQKVQLILQALNIRVRLTDTNALVYVGK